MAKTAPIPRAGRFAFDGLDRALHERARLGIMAALAAGGAGLRFGELRTQCALTDGNLSRHLEVLKRAGVVEVWKGYQGRRPQTICRLTAAGRRRFRDYLRLLRAIAEETLPAAARRPPRAAPPAGCTKT